MSSSQQYTLHIDEDQALLEIIIQPEVSFSVLVASQADTQRLAEEKGLRKVLVDARQMQHTPTLPEFYTFGQGMKQSTLLTSLRYALVGTPMTGLQLQFLRGVTRKLGIAMEIFDTPEEARLWLNRD